MEQVNPTIAGIWNLISFMTEADDGTATYAFGKDVGGLIMIDNKGYFSAQVMNMERPSFKTPDPRAGTSERLLRTTLDNMVRLIWMKPKGKLSSM